MLSGVTSGKLISSPPATSCAPYNSTQEHHRANAHMEKLERFVGFRTHLSLCLNLSRPLSTQRFTDNTGCNLAEQPMSYDNLVTSRIRSAKRKWRLSYVIAHKCTAGVLRTYGQSSTLTMGRKMETHRV